MPIITKIEPQKNKKRVNVHLDHKFGFGLDLENYVKLGLKVEQELDEKEIAEIVRKAEFQKVYDNILKFASLRPRSRREFELWLRKHKVHESLHEDLFIKLKQLDLIGDEKFASWWIQQRTTFRPRGKKALFMELRQKGVKRDIIENALNDADINETSQAKKLFEKNKYKWEKLDEYDARRKASSFLQRKGFGWDVINEIIRGSVSS